MPIAEVVRTQGGPGVATWLPSPDSGDAEGRPVAKLLVIDMAAEDARFVGLVTRAAAWLMDALIINVAAVIAGLGVALILSIFPLGHDVQPALEAVAGAAYLLWAAAYFVVFWSIAGQTPGARVMQIRLTTARQQRVAPTRALIRWVGMNLAMLPLFAGYLPVAFRRRPFPDWLAHTVVLDAPQVSLAEARRQSLRAARDAW